VHRRPPRALLAAALALTVLTPTLTAAPAAATPSGPVDRGGAVVTTSVAGPGEGLLTLTVGAPGADWSAAAGQGAVVEVDVDGGKASDLVVPTPTPTRRRVQLGSLGVGAHTVTVRLSPTSPRDSAAVDALQASVPADPALAYAPVVYGRTLPAYGSVTQNAVDDAPVLSWHETAPGSTPGTTAYEFSMIWTNEDNGTGSPDLMARYGRTTDIEYAYRATVADATGTVIRETFQGPNHVETVFRGRHEGTHPLLQTCTGNNNFCDDDTPDEAGRVAPVGGPLRFLLAYDESRDPGRARESVMDRHPWVYPVMAAEQVREGKVTPSVCLPAATDTVHICDQRHYLYLEVAKTTTGPLVDPTGNAPQPIGISLGVQLRDGRVFRSDRGIPGRSATRDVPVATTVELPAGTTENDVLAVLGYRVDSQPGTPDPKSTVTVNGLARGFLLDPDWLPRPSFVSAGGPVVLPQDGSGAVLWTAPAAPALPEAPLPLVFVVVGLGVTVAWRRRAA